MSERSTILLVDDVLEIRYLLRMLLANVRHCQIVGEAENGVRTLELVRELRPEIVVLVHPPDFTRRQMIRRCVSFAS